MNFKDKELIIFDFDGTLINSIPDLTLAVNTMLSHYEAKPLTIEEVTPFIGNGAMPLVKRALGRALPNQELSEAFLNEAFKVYLAAYQQVTCKDTFMYPGVLETLKYLDDKSYKLAICTNKPFGFIKPILDKLEITQYFKSWVGEDSLPEKKPHAAPLFHIAEEMNTTIENSIMVGDSKNDILAAQNANMESIGVSYGYNYNENIADYKPTVVVDHFSEIQELF
ncbi:phosphoglycolate phosphatase [Tamlana sp. 2_MG-2023]|uniref:phosphoglycolate phosphatase n=1 Tax=unclassified Tamlana TaxID=2614803 RepID=UPI0026E30B04|nr:MULTISPECIES: phosphoglycolate phosphatase [unclassified Tamlana]MDO6761494.1 phosphoglycolate phosphatase [Tamlana sp. 2_MG-2023]MDO6792331.1 phosphoglycolate phosphatase [Tamlana sp. 1_MG-2023]